jgi:hypothetical protein
MSMACACRAPKARDGFDPGATDDAIYFDDPASDAFVPLDHALYERIKAGVVRF